MAVAARKLDYEERYTPVTRVYSHRAATAPKLEEQQAPAAAPHSHAKAKARPHIARKLVSMVAIAASLAALLAVMIRYALIAGEYSAVNEIRQQITESQRSIDSLNVQLNEAVSFEQARQAALAAGMGYPTAEQIIRIQAQDNDVSPEPVEDGRQ